MKIEDIMIAFGKDEEVKSVILMLEPFIQTLSREEDELFDKFIDLVNEGKWLEIDEMMWPLMTEDERDKLHHQVHQVARQTVQNMYDSEVIIRKILLKALTTAIGMI